MQSKQQGRIVRQKVLDEIFTDRQEYLDYFYETALKAATCRAKSTVLLGRRRMGKTEIFSRVVNRLFFEQDPKDASSVVPVYYSFQDIPQDRVAFAIEYLENFIRHYIAFYLQRPDILTEEYTGHELLELLDSVKSTHPFPDSLDTLAYWREVIGRDKPIYPEKLALHAPGRIADQDESGIVVFLDEFQNTRLPHQNGFDIVGLMQEAVESPYGPHFVTGSAMSILVREIIGYGPLFGRFRSKPIEPLSEYWGAVLALKAGAYHQVAISELMAPVLAERCGGNPFYIDAVVQQAAESNQSLLDEEAINNVLAVDISSGLIWTELLTQVNSWIRRINDQNITKWILYLSAIEEGEEISLERIQQELEKREGTFVELDKIRDVLIRLSHGDLLEYFQFGDWFRKIDDPILLEFLKVWGRVEVERQNQGLVQNELLLKYEHFKRRYDEFKGYLAEVFMSQVLLSSFQVRAYPGHFFNSDQDIPIRNPVIFVYHRSRLYSGEGNEIDILASIGGHMWVCQSKWVTTRKMDVKALQELLGQAAAVKAKDNPKTLYKWIFAHEGLTKDAVALAKKEGIFWSTRTQLDDLLIYLGLRKLPEILPEG